MPAPHRACPAVSRGARAWLWALSTAALVGCAGAERHAGDSPADVAAATLTVVGQEAPAFVVATLDGGSFDLADHRGRTVLIDFYATWCPPCREAMPHLQRLWERHRHDRDFAMVAVAREETAAEVEPFRREFRLEFPLALDPERAAFARYATAFIPRTYVIAPDGTIAFQSQGYDAEEFARLEAVLAEHLQVKVP